MRRARIAVGVLCLCLPRQAASQEVAVSADSFVDSIGVNTHLTYYNTAYGNWAQVLAALQGLGVRHIRDGAHSDTTYVGHLQFLATIGIFADCVADPADNVFPSCTGRPASCLAIDTFILLAPTDIESIEGPNETDVNSKFSYGDAGFPLGTIQYMSDAKQALLGNAATAATPLVMASMAMYQNMATLCAATSCPLSTVDLGNMHSYPGAYTPDTGLATNLSADGAASGSAKPMVATETGYNNCDVSGDCGPNSTGEQPGLPEDVEGKYAVRLPFEYFNAGVLRAYFYELVDEDQEPSPEGAGSPESTFGLLHYDFTPKAAYTGLANTIQILSDPGPSFTPGALDYALSGATQNVHHTLLQKRDGTFYLALWLDSSDWIWSNWNDGTGSSVTVAPQVVTLQLATPIASATTYQPLTSADAGTPLASPTSLALSVPDSPIIVALTPAVAGSMGGGTGGTSATTTSGGSSSGATEGTSGGKGGNGSSAAASSGASSSGGTTSGGTSTGSLAASADAGADGGADTRSVTGCGCGPREGTLGCWIAVLALAWSCRRSRRRC